MATFAPIRSSFLPKVPQNFADLGVPESLVLDLMLRRAVIEGFCSMAGLSRSLRVSMPIVDLVFKHMRSQQLVEIKGMSGNDYQFTLSGAGKQLATERFQARSRLQPTTFGTPVRLELMTQHCRLVWPRPAAGLAW